MRIITNILWLCTYTQIARCWANDMPLLPGLAGYSQGRCFARLSEIHGFNCICWFWCGHGARAAEASVLRVPLRSAELHKRKPKNICPEAIISSKGPPDIERLSPKLLPSTDAPHYIFIYTIQFKAREMADWHFLSSPSLRQSARTSH